MDVYFYQNQHELLKGVNEILSMNAGMMEIKIYNKEVCLTATLNLQYDFDAAEWILYKPIRGEFYAAFINLNNKIWMNTSPTATMPTTSPIMEFLGCDPEDLENAKLATKFLQEEVDEDEGPWLSKARPHPHVNKCRAQKRRISSSLSGEEDVPVPAKRRLFEKDEEENAEAEVDKENEKPAVHVRPIRNSFKKYASLANMDVSDEEESDEDEEETDESDGEEEEKENGKEENRKDEESSGEDEEDSGDGEDSDEDEEDSDEDEEDSDEDEEDSDEDEEESEEDEEEEDDQSKDWKRVSRFFEFEAKCR